MNYTEDSLKTSFDKSEGYIVNKETGEFMGETDVKAPSKFYLTKQGYRRIYMKEDGVYEKFMKSLSSGLENGIAIDFMRDINGNGILKHDQSHYAEQYDTTVNTVSKVFVKAKKFGLFKAAGRDIYVNPYVVLPYNSSDINNYFLQRRWLLIWKLSDECNGKVTKQQADALTIDLRAEIDA